MSASVPGAEAGGVVLFDLRSLASRPTGVGRYLGMLASAWLDRNRDDGVALTQGHQTAALLPRMRQLDLPGSGLTWHVRAWRAARNPAVRAYVSSSLIVPSLPGVHARPVVLDLTSMQFPEFHTIRTRLAERALLPNVLRRHPIITASETAARDIRDHFPAVRQLFIVPPWVAMPLPGVRDDASLEDLGIRSRYALYVGTLEPRKNVSTAIRAISMARREGADITLVLVGSMGWRSTEIEREVNAAVTAGEATWLGYVSDTERDAVYRGADMLLLPSHYEGFGLPVLEAMSYGVPVVTSTAPALVEVTRDAAIHVPASDVAAWATEIHRLIASADLRQRMSRAAVLRATAFDRDRTRAALSVAIGGY